MPGMIRTNEEAKKIAYKVNKTPKVLQQRNEEKPPEKLIKEWFVDSSSYQ